MPKPLCPPASWPNRATSASLPPPPTKTADTPVSCFVVSEGTGWAARLRRVMNARMEEMSFRSGVALFAAVLALIGTGIAFTVTLGASHGAAAPPASPATAVPGSTAPPSSAEAVPSPSARPSPDQSSPVYGSGPAVADASSPGATTQAASPQTSPASPSPTYRPMGLAPSHSLTSPGPGGPGVNPPPGWLPP
jgi:hypothetical protein